MAVVIHQETWRGKHRHSQIRYEFRDSSGRLARGKRGPTSLGDYMRRHGSTYLLRPDQSLGECGALRCYLRTKNRLAVR